MPDQTISSPHARPPCASVHRAWPEAIFGSTIAHSASVRSVGYRKERRSAARRWSGFHIEHPPSIRVLDNESHPILPTQHSFGKAQAVTAMKKWMDCPLWRLKSPEQASISECCTAAVAASGRIFRAKQQSGDNSERAVGPFARAEQHGNWQLCVVTARFDLCWPCLRAGSAETNY